MKKTLLAIVLILMVFLTGCGKKDKVLGNFVSTGSVKLKTPMTIRNAFITETGFVALDAVKSRLVHFNLDAEITAEYIAEGNGPGEFLSRSSKLLGFRDNVIYLGDFQRNTILLLSLEDKGNKIKYIDEFNIDDGRIFDGILDDAGNIVVYTQFSAYTIKKYNINGERTESYIPVEEKDRNFSFDKMMHGMKRLNVKGDNFILVSMMGYDMEFYEKKGKDLELIKASVPEIIYVKEPFKMEMTGRRFKMEGKPGIQNLFFYKEHLILNVLEDKEKPEKDHYFLSYDAKGNYTGRFIYELKDNSVIGAVLGVLEDGRILATINTSEELESPTDTIYFLELK